MSFAEPILLAGFILVPLAMLAYGSLQRRRKRDSAAWANPALVPGLTPRGPAGGGTCRRCCCCSRCAALIFALARPQRTVAAPQRAANIVMVTDISGSMNATDVQPNRLEAAVAAAKTLTEKVPETFRLGLVTFSDFAEQRVAPTTDRAQMRGALDQLVAEGGTAMGDGLERGLFVGAHAGPERQRQRRAPAAVGDRPALRRQEHVRARATRSTSPARPGAPRSRSTRSRSARPAARSSCATRSASCRRSRSRRTPRR